MSCSNEYNECWVYSDWDRAIDVHSVVFDKIVKMAAVKKKPVPGRMAVLDTGFKIEILCARER